MSYYYQDLIHELDPTINPAGVEASMRDNHSTLDHMRREAFRQDTHMARAMEELYPGYLENLANCHAMQNNYQRWEQTLRTETNNANQISLETILRNAHHKAIVNRDQSPEEIASPDNPHIAPGWNAVHLGEIVAGMFSVTAMTARGLIPNREHRPGISQGEAELAAPGLAEKIRQTVREHRVSERLHAALSDEVRAIASQIAQELEPPDAQALLDRSGRYADLTARDTWQDPTP